MCVLQINGHLSDGNLNVIVSYITLLLIMIVIIINIKCRKNIESHDRNSVVTYMLYVIITVYLYQANRMKSSNIMRDGSQLYFFCSSEQRRYAILFGSRI